MKRYFIVRLMTVNFVRRLLSAFKFIDINEELIVRLSSFDCSVSPLRLYCIGNKVLIGSFCGDTEFQFVLLPIVLLLRFLIILFGVKIFYLDSVIVLIDMQNSTLTAKIII